MGRSQVAQNGCPAQRVEFGPVSHKKAQEVFSLRIWIRTDGDQ